MDHQNREAFSCLHNNPEGDKNEERNFSGYVDFEDVLQDVGGWGRFQIIQLLIFLPLTILMAYVCYSPILLLYTPDHWCSPSPAEESAFHDIYIPWDSNGKRSKCYMYFNESDEISECKYGWTYNFTGHFRTIATDGAFTQAMFSVGGVLGTLVFGYAADHLGRKPIFYVTNIILVATGLLTPLCTNFLSFTLIRFLMGLANLTFYNIFFLLTLEYVTIEKRALVGNLALAIGITLGGIIQPWLILWLGHWQSFLYVIYAQGYVKESARWLASKGRVSESTAILREIAEINGCHLGPRFDQSMQEMLEHHIDKDKDNKNHANWTDLFRTPRLRKHVILMIVTWMLIASMFDGHIRNISNLSQSIYTTFTISSSLELPADLLAIWGLNYFGRRWSAFGSQALTALAMFLCALYKDDVLTTTVFAMIGRFFATYAMNTGAQISFEIVPTTLRAQGNALANVFAQVSQFFSPFIVYSGVHSKGLPFLLLGFGSTVGAAVSIFLPETANEDLPDSVEEAERFGLDQKFHHIPCLRVRKSKKNGGVEESEKEVEA